MEIPSNATIRRQYVKCGKPQCQKKHGPYLYAYWKEGNKTKSGYVGKKLEGLDLRKIAKDQDLRPSVLRKFEYIQQEASRDNVLAKQYFEKLRNRKVRIDWAYRLIINRSRVSLEKADRTFIKCFQTNGLLLFHLNLYLFQVHIRILID